MMMVNKNPFPELDHRKRIFFKEEIRRKKRYEPGINP